jgi:hypothetical protein
MRRILFSDIQWSACQLKWTCSHLADSTKKTVLYHKYMGVNVVLRHFSELCISWFLWTGAYKGKEHYDTWAVLRFNTIQCKHGILYWLEQRNVLFTFISFGGLVAHCWPGVRKSCCSHGGTLLARREHLLLFAWWHTAGQTWASLAVRMVAHCWTDFSISCSTHGGTLLARREHLLLIAWWHTAGQASASLADCTKQQCIPHVLYFMPTWNIISFLEHANCFPRNNMSSLVGVSQYVVFLFLVFQ